LIYDQIFPSPVGILGNGQQFTLTVDEVDPATIKANVTQLMTDWIAYVLNTAIGVAANLQQTTGLESCGQQGAATIVAGLGSTLNTILVSSQTGAQASAALARSLTGSLLLGGVQAALSCAAPNLTAAATAATKNLANFIIPSRAVWLALQFGAGAVGPSTETFLTFYYLNKSQPVAVCESNGALVTCAPSTRTYNLGSVQATCCNQDNVPGWVYGFSSVVNDPSVTGNVNITSMAVTATVCYSLVADGGGFSFDWGVFADPGSLGLPVGQVSSTTDPSTLTSPAAFQWRAVQTGNISTFTYDPSCGATSSVVTMTYNFADNSLATSGGGTATLLSAAGAPVMTTDGLNLQFFGWTDVNANVLSFSNVTVTITGLPPGSQSSIRK
jgi:hypothetical protein